MRSASPRHAHVLSGILLLPSLRLLPRVAPRVALPRPHLALPALPRLRLALPTLPRLRLALPTLPLAALPLRTQAARARARAARRRSSRSSGYPSPRSGHPPGLHTLRTPVKRPPPPPSLPLFVDSDGLHIDQTAPKPTIMDLQHWLSSEPSEDLEGVSAAGEGLASAAPALAAAAPPLASADRFAAKALAAANRATRTKEELLAEMEVHMPAALASEVGARLRTAAVEAPLVYWRRLVDTEYNEALDLFVPCEPAEVWEPHVVVWMAAQAVVEGVADALLGATVAQHVAQFRRAAGGVREPVAVLVIEGYDKCMARLRAAEDRAFKLQVRRDMGQAPRRRGAGCSVGVADVAARLNELELAQRVNVFCTKSPQDTVEWLVLFTHAVAQRRYRRDSGARVRPGTDARSTYLKLLQQFRFVTEVRAERVCQYYPLLRALWQRLRREAGLGRVEGDANVVPPLTDRAMHTYFTARDPHQVLE